VEKDPDPDLDRYQNGKSDPDTGLASRCCRSTTLEFLKTYANSLSGEKLQ